MARVGRKLLVASALTTLTVTAGCGSGASAVNDGEMPAEIKIVSVTDHTGSTAYTGNGQFEGVQLAVEQINNQGYLGSSRIVLQQRDSASDLNTAVSQVTETQADRTVSALIGPVSSAHSVAVAPIVERAKLPTVFTQSGSEGVVIGDYTYRATAPMASYYGVALDHLKKLGAQRVSVLYNSGLPSLAEIGENVLPGAEYGFDIVSSTSVQSSTQDFATSATKIAAERPDAVAVLLLGAQNSTAIAQLRQAGFDGPVVSSISAGAGNLAPAGAAAAGVFWSTDFSFHQTNTSSREFVVAYRAKFGKDPLNYAAEGYDAAWMIARAVKASGGASREDVQQGLSQVVAEGFDGALGAVRFEGNDMRVDGVLVEWDGTAEVLLAE